MRIGIGQLSQETNHFAPTLTRLENFQDRLLLLPDQVLAQIGEGRTEVPAFIHTLRQAGVEPVPSLCAATMASGPVETATFEHLLGLLVQRFREAVRLDGVLLSLHGAMVTEELDDPEAEIIARVRAALPPGTKIGVSLDLHGHITPAMLQPDTFLIGYREYPHIDMWETGARTASLLLDWIAGRCRPVMAMAKRPMVVSPSVARTPDPPLSHVKAAATAMMEQGRVLHAALFPVQPWLDVPDLGFTALVCADGDVAAAQRAADELADMAWAARTEFEPAFVPLEEAIRIGLSSLGMTLIGDTGDGPTGGAPADSADVLRALLAAGADRHDRPVLLTLNDAPAVQAAMQAGIGAMVEVSLGHSISPGQKVHTRAQVSLLSDGEYRMQDSAATGMLVENGPTAVLRIGAIRLAVRSRPSWEWDTGMYRSVGLDPAAASMVFVKSPGHFRVAFEPLAARWMMADTGGATRGNLRKLPWTRVTRPLWPLDP